MVSGWGKWGQRDSYGVWGLPVYNAIFKMDNQQGPIVEHSELFSVLCGSLNERELREE